MRISTMWRDIAARSELEGVGWKEWDCLSWCFCNKTHEVRRGDWYSVLLQPDCMSWAEAHGRFDG